MMPLTDRPRTFQEARERGVKKKADALTEVVLADPISLPIAYVISRYAPVHPLVVSGFAFAARAAGAWKFAHGELLLGAALAFAGFVLDAVDGKVARMTRRSEVLHGSFDFLLDALAFATLIVALVYWAGDEQRRSLAFGLATWLGLLYFYMAASSTAYRLAAALGISETTRRGAGDAVSRILQEDVNDPVARTLVRGYRAYVRLLQLTAKYRVLPFPTIVDSEVTLFVIAPLLHFPSWLTIVALAFLVPDIFVVLGGILGLARQPVRSTGAMSRNPGSKIPR
jgi:phosphatidylglycerophosphate synthase